MSYVDELLADNEQIRFEARQHAFVLLTRILFETVVLVILVTAVWYITKTQWGDSGKWIMVVLGILGLLVLMSAIYDVLKWRTEQFILTDRRVIHLRGIINKTTIDSSLEKINDVQLRQTFFGRMFNFGDLEIQTASEDGTNYLQHIQGPLEFKRAMLNAKTESERVPQAYMDAPPASYQQPRLSADDVEAQLLRLTELRQKNLITEDDFNAKKREILSRM